MTGPVPTAWLEGSGPTSRGLRFDLGLEPARLGRASRCAIPLTDRLVSREHAEIRHGPEGFTIVDLGSTHGTWVDDQQVKEAALVDGSRLRLGGTEFTFHLPQEAIPTAMLGAEGRPVLPAKAAPRPAPAAPVQATAAPAVPRPATAGAPAQPPSKKSRPSKLLLACGGLVLLAICICAAVAVVGMITGSGGVAAAINQLLDRASGSHLGRPGAGAGRTRCR